MGAAAVPTNQDLVYVVGEDGKTMSYEDEQMGVKSKLTFTKR